MPEQENTIKLKFKSDFTSPTLEVAHADYHRVFKASDQPFAASEAEFQRHLSRLNLFVVASDSPLPQSRFIKSEASKEKE